MKIKKVLIISMTGGFGHLRAGEALLDFAKEHLRNVRAEHVDVADIDTSLKKYTGNFYQAISKKFPFVWRFVYQSPLATFAAKKVIGAKGFLDGKVRRYIFEKKPDAIIFTNTVILPMVAGACRRMFPNLKMGVVVTDYHGHPYYQSSALDYYFVAHQQVKEDLQALGIAPQKIVISGIPINPRFYVKENIKSLKLKYGIKNGLPIVVMIASFRISKNDLLKTVTLLLAQKPELNLICITSKDQELYDMLYQQFFGHDRFLLVHWTNVIEEYMKVSDVVISKAGGLTVSECIALKKPLIIVNPIPGQEEHNAKFMEKNNLGGRVDNVHGIITMVHKVLSVTKKTASTSPQKNPSEKIFEYLLK